jgi:dolichol-phosphate mannosyltransferase
MPPKVLVFTPTFNEVDNIRNLLVRILDVSPELNILVVDDSSNDGTMELLANLSKTINQLTVVFRPKRSGIGSAHMVAIQNALEGGYDLLVTLDADLSHDPEDITRFIEASKFVNYVVGTRSRGGETELKGMRRILSKGANLLCRVLLPCGLSEYTTAYRCYDKAAMRVMLDQPPKDEGYSFFIEATEILFRRGLKLGEIPILFRNRHKGESKIPSMQVFKSAAKILLLFSSRIIWKLSWKR